ncbi:MAG: glycosyltransferase [Candidatus Geothermincolia bacterium]
MAGIIDKIMGRKEQEIRQLKECECSMEGMRVTNMMRKIWDDHVFWTREVILVAAMNEADSPVVGAAVARLMKNQEDIGDLMVPYYGRAAGDRLTELLKDHIKYAIELVLAAKADEADKQEKATEAWYENARDISRFLSDANPTSWPFDAVVKMMNDHLRLTTDEAVSILGMNYEEAVHDFELVREEILMMSDSITGGIMMQFPEKFMSMAETKA